MLKKEFVDIKTKFGILKSMKFFDGSFAGKKPAILVIHGWTSQMSRYPERFQNMAEMGYMVFMFDMRGHGETGGDLNTFSISDHFDDVLAAYDYMIDLEEVDKENISVFGSSYGGYMAALLSRKRDFHQLALNVPALYSDEIFDKVKMQVSNKTKEYRKYSHGPHDNMALKSLSDFDGDVLIIEAEKDEQVPKQVLDDYKNAAKKPKYEIVIGADHSFKNPGTNERRVEILTNWFRKFI